MSTLKIYDIDSQTYKNLEIFYNGPFNEATLPTYLLKANLITDIEENDINECLSLIFEENTDAFYNQITYSSKSKKLVILSNNVLKINNWVSYQKINKIKTSIINDLEYLIKNTNKSKTTSLKDIVTIQQSNNNSALTSLLLTIENSIKEIYPKVSLTLLDYDNEYKDIFISIIINDENYDFNIWPFDDEIIIEDYTENEISKNIKRIISNKTSLITMFYKNLPNNFDYKINIDNTNLILHITNNSIEITNNYTNDYERILILYIGEYTKYSPYQQIYDIIKNNEELILNNIIITIPEIKPIIKELKKGEN